MYSRLSTRLLVPSRISVAKSRPQGFHYQLVRHYSWDVENLKQENNQIDTDNSAETTGVLEYQHQTETVLYFNHLYPFAISKLQFQKYFRFLLSSVQNRYTNEKVIEQVEKLTNTDTNPLPSDAKIIDLVPLKRDGGAFVKYQIPQNMTSKEFINQIESNIKENELDSHKNIFKFVQNLIWNNHPTAHQVKGVPWIEDLSRFPSSRIKVIFEGDPLTEEELYLLFRRYGLITDIIPPKADPFATIIFRSIKSAISAKNCVTGLSLNKGKTVLHLQYIPIKRVNYITDFIVNHQRISIPTILAIIATVAVLIFDPIRQFFIELKIGQTYSLEKYKDNEYVKVIYSPFQTVKGWITTGYNYIDDHLNSTCEEIIGLQQSTGDSEKINILWNERFERIKQLKLWIHENINTFMIIKGPKGSGKQEFVMEHTLGNDPVLGKKVLFIDCDNLAKSRSDNSLIQNFANQVGYFPIFTWTNSVSQFIDLGVQSVTGQKSGLSESKETQLKNILLLATQAIRSVGLSGFNDYQKATERRNRHNGEQVVIKEDDYLQQFPEEKPIIVIDKFMKKTDGNHDFIYKLLSDWTAQLIQSNLAHVIYITHDVGSIQHLTDSLPNQVFKTISLSDASEKSSQQYVINQLGNDFEAKHEIDTCLKPLGGRMLDLQAFVRRIKSGETPKDALNEMVSQAAEQVTTFFLNHTDNKEFNWSSAQIWTIMRLLSDKDEISFEEMNKCPLFKSSNETMMTLSTLEKNDLISLKRDKGILSSISTGRPLYKAAFQDLVGDEKIFKFYEVDYYTNLINIENTKIVKYEEEVNKISQLNDLSLLKERLNYLSDKIKGSTYKIIGYEERISKIEKTGHESKSILNKIF